MSEKTKGEYCPSCTLAWVLHPGMIQTCAELQEARKQLAAAKGEIEKLNSELQKRRGVKKKTEEYDWRADYDARARNSFNAGWNACVDAMEKAAK